MGTPDEGSSLKTEYKSGKGLYTADYQMWGFEYKRLNSILEVVASLFLVVREQPKNVLSLVDAMREAWRICKPLAHRGTKTRIDKRFEDIIKDMKEERKKAIREEDLGREPVLSDDAYKKLSTLCDEIYDIRQIVGMGMTATARSDRKARLKRALSGK